MLLKMWLLMIVPTLRVGTQSLDALRPVGERCTVLNRDAERPRPHSHAERGNDQPSLPKHPA